MQVAGHWHATNITENPVTIPNAYLAKPRTDGHVMVRHPAQDIHGMYPVLPATTTEISADFWVQPPTEAEGNVLSTKVIFVDQYGNSHSVKTVFRGRARTAKTVIERPIEAVHAIDDPIEKRVVAVLQAELDRYKQCGRGAGGLGSVQTSYGGRTYSGFGTEWREVDSPRNQAIVIPTIAGSISSDNCDALIGLYRGMSSDEDKSTFVVALLKRLGRDTGYASVSYLVLLVLFRIGSPSQALTKAKADLMGDSSRGFSDFLRMLDGLLRFDHTSFKNEWLDEIEQFLDGVVECPTHIYERLSAIRALRIGQKQY